MLVVFDLRGDLHVVDQISGLLSLVQTDLPGAEAESEGAEEEGVTAGDDGQHVAPQNILVF